MELAKNYLEPEEFGTIMQILKNDTNCGATGLVITEELYNNEYDRIDMLEEYRKTHKNYKEYAEFILDNIHKILDSGKSKGTCVIEIDDSYHNKFDRYLGHVFAIVKVKENQMQLYKVQSYIDVCSTYASKYTDDDELLFNALLSAKNKSHRVLYWNALFNVSEKEVLTGCTMRVYLYFPR